MTEKAMTWKQVDAFCEDHRESDGFCRVCTACSGPTPSNLATDRPYPEGCVVLRGGNHGGCTFVVRDAKV
jgi:hypothetical protein